ncbi:MAG: disulfide bond formation protein B [Pseudomonadota bacterium]
MTARSLVLLAAFGSAALLAGAFVFQWLGYAPCRMCLWQRYPHVLAAGLGLAFLALPSRAIPWLGAAAAAVTGGIGVFHAGVEQGWWPGPSSCSGGGSLSGLSGGDLLSLEAAPAIVMCDEIAWQFLGVSMAGWNAAFSFALTALWIVAARGVSSPVNPAPAR